MPHVLHVAFAWLCNILLQSLSSLERNLWNILIFYLLLPQEEKLNNLRAQREAFPEFTAAQQAKFAPIEEKLSEQQDRILAAMYNGVPNARSLFAADPELELREMVKDDPELEVA